MAGVEARSCSSCDGFSPIHISRGMCFQKIRDALIEGQGTDFAFHWEMALRPQERGV